MTQAIDITYQGRAFRFLLTPIDRKRLHGFKRRIAMDENGGECETAHLTRDGRFLLSAGCTAALYVNEEGDAVNRNELVAVDTDGNSLPTLPSTLNRPQDIAGPVELDEFLSHVVAKVYALEAESLDPALHKALRDGAIFRAPYRPRPTYDETPAFLLANENGVFLMQAAPSDFEFIGLEQTVTEMDGEWDDVETDADEFDFDVDWEADHALA